MFYYEVPKRRKLYYACAASKAYGFLEKLHVLSFKFFM